MVLALEDFAIRARGKPVMDRRALVEELENLAHAVPDVWRDEPAVCVALARAFAAVEDFQRAVAQYERALRADRSGARHAAPLAVVDELIAAREAWAAALSLTGTPRDRRQALRLRTEAADLRAHLAALTR
jgi:hypothetical protein